MFDEVRIPPLKDGVHQQVHSGLGIEVTVGTERGSQVRARPNPSGSSA